MKKKVIYVVPRDEKVNYFNFTANRYLFKTFKSIGCTGHFDMNMTEIVEFSDVSCSPMPGEFDNIPT